MATAFVRGTSIEWSVTFEDSAGDSANPTSASLRINYCRNGDDTTDTVTLSQSGSTWTGAWDSKVADEGQIHWHVRSAGALISGTDGRFTLQANEANNLV